ncbi:Elongator subunit elp2 [Gaertneriomyces sp. JEL0708]|nr:Elongator subunit elp2 [Gaertneriomyces sp. JEL0708]
MPSSSIAFASISCNRSSQSVDWAFCQLSGTQQPTPLLAYTGGPFTVLVRPTTSSASQNEPTLKVINLLKTEAQTTALRFIHRNGLDNPATHLLTASGRNLYLYDLSSPSINARVLKGHEASITCVAVPRGLGNAGAVASLVASAGSDGTVRIWDFSRPVGEESVQVINVGPKMVMSLAIGTVAETPVVFTGGVDKKISMYVGDNKGSFEKKLELQGHTDWIRSLELATCTVDQHGWRRGDVMLCSASQDRYVRIWKISVLEEKVEKGTDGSAATSLQQQMMDALSEGSGKLSTKAHILSISDRKTVLMFDALLMGHDDWVLSVAWESPRLNTATNQWEQPMRLVTASSDKSIMVWKPSGMGVWINTTRLGEIGGSTLGFHNALFAPDGQGLVACAYHGAIQYWTSAKDAEDEWTPRPALSGHSAEVRDLKWDPLGRWFMTTSKDQTTRLWANSTAYDWHELARPQIHGYDLNCLEPLQDGLTFVSGADEKVVRVFTAPQIFLSTVRNVLGIAVSDAGKLPLGASVPALGLSNKAVYENDTTLELTTDFRNMSAYAAAPAQLTGLDKPPLEQQLLQGTLWPEVEKLYGHQYEIYSVGAGHGVVASASKATTAKAAQIRLWDSRTWRPTGLLEAHNLTVTHLAFSPHTDPEQQYLLSVSRDRSWALSTRAGGDWRILKKQEKAHARIIWSAKWLTERLFVTGSRDKTIKVWDVEGRMIGSVNADEGVNTLDVYHQEKNGRYILAIGSETGHVAFYSLVCPPSNDQEAKASFVFLYSVPDEQIHVGGVAKVQFGPTKDEQLVLSTCGVDGSVRILHVTL